MVIPVATIIDSHARSNYPYLHKPSLSIALRKIFPLNPIKLIHVSSRNPFNYIQLSSSSSSQYLSSCNDRWMTSLFPSTRKNTIKNWQNGDMVCASCDVTFTSWSSTAQVVHKSDMEMERGVTYFKMYFQIIWGNLGTKRVGGQTKFCQLENIVVAFLTHFDFL